MAIRWLSRITRVNLISLSDNVGWPQDLCKQNPHKTLVARRRNLKYDQSGHQEWLGNESGNLRWRRKVPWSRNRFSRSMCSGKNLTERKSSSASNRRPDGFGGFVLPRVLDVLKGVKSWTQAWTTRTGKNRPTASGTLGYGRTRRIRCRSTRACGPTSSRRAGRQYSKCW